MDLEIGYWQVRIEQKKMASTPPAGLAAHCGAICPMQCPPNPTVEHLNDRELACLPLSIDRGRHYDISPTQND